ncbi:MAG: hypothetical protein K0B85_09405 [Coriobacteriia bacterium]|nr:hypothetical protein [Coriobacteriia bacterium]
MHRSTPLSYSRTVQYGLLLVVVLMLTLLPVAAAAAPLGALNIVLMYESSSSDTPLLGITARLADDVPLPAEIVLPAPESANVMWSGEFFLEEGRENIPVPARQETREGVPVIVFTLSQSRLGHAEVVYPGSTVVTNALSGVEEIGFDLTLPYETGPVYAGIAVPPTVSVLAGSDVVQESREADGLTYYFVERPSGTPGDSVALSLQVREVAPPDLYNERVPWMVALVAIIIIGAAVALVLRQKRGRTEG